MHCKDFLVICVSMLAPIAAHAQPFPSKPIRMVIPQAVGGTTDTIARAIAQGLEPVLGTSVVPDDLL